MKKHFLLFSLVIILFSACKKGGFDAAKQATIDDEKIRAYIAANKIDVVKDPSGVYYKILKLDTGNNHPSLADTIQVTYTGKLLNGTQFDAQTATVLPTPLSNLIKGWQITLPLLTSDDSHVNYSRIRLIVPSGLAYGNSSGGTIPANSVLDFQIDLIGFYGPGAK